MSPATLVKPRIWIRSELFTPYLHNLQDWSKNIYVEPWSGPELSSDIPIEDIDLLVTFGVHDKVPFFKHMPNLKWIHSLSVGVESLLTEEIQQSEVMVTNVRGCTAVPMAEYTLAAILSWSRGLPGLWRHQQNKQWSRVAVHDLEDSVVGIVGYGTIGREIARRCKALGMKVIACRRSEIADYNADVDIMMTPNDVDKLLTRSDFVVNCLPSTPQNVKFFDAAKFGFMRKESLFINIGRGATVDESALLKALNSKQIGGAYLDVFQIEPLPNDHPFWTMDNVYITPHSAYASPKNHQRLAQNLLENLTRFVYGQPLLNQVNKRKGY